jgi:hypothetical protein
VIAADENMTFLWRGRGRWNIHLHRVGHHPACHMKRWYQMPPKDSPSDNTKAAQQPDRYMENGLLVYTAAYHLKRGSCCGSGCRHCPYAPKHIAGNTKVR